MSNAVTLETGACTTQLELYSVLYMRLCVHVWVFIWISLVDIDSCITKH